MVLNFKTFYFLLIICTISFTLGASAKKKSSDKKTSPATTSTAIENSNKRLSDISSLLQQNKVIKLTDSNFTKYVSERPRHYQAALFFTAIDKKYKCSVCAKARKVYSQAAEFYSQQYDFSSVAPSERIVFFLLDVDSARNIFNNMELETVPRLYVLPSREIDQPKQKAQDFEVDTSSLMEGR